MGAFKRGKMSSYWSGEREISLKYFARKMISSIKIVDNKAWTTVGVVKCPVIWTGDSEQLFYERALESDIEY